MSLEIRSDGTFTAGGEEGAWSRIAPTVIRFDVQDASVDSYDWPYIVEDEHLVLGPLRRTDDGVELAGSTWYRTMEQRNMAGSSALEEHSWTINLYADGAAAWSWRYQIAGMVFGPGDTGTWTGDIASGFSLNLMQYTQYSDTFTISGSRAWPARATYSRVCN